MGYLKELTALFQQHRNPENAEPMAKYMKYKFPFLGIKTPERKRLLRDFYNKTGILKDPVLPEKFIKGAWEMPDREYHYAAISLLASKPGWLRKDHLPLLEELITTNSWWDSVDPLATQIIGRFFTNYPHLENTAAEVWAEHHNMWLRRTAILYQLKYKDKTDEDTLYKIIRMNREDPEFFIRKAIGWVLREYSKTKPQSVETFIGSETLSPLSRREGLKHINRERSKRGECDDSINE